MTDKQIIIDGIDVCRCRHYDDRYGYCDACKDDIDGNSLIGKCRDILATKAYLL